MLEEYYKLKTTSIFRGSFFVLMNFFIFEQTQITVNMHIFTIIEFFLLKLSIGVDNLIILNYERKYECK